MKLYIIIITTIGMISALRWEAVRAHCEWRAQYLNP